MTSQQDWRRNFEKFLEGRGKIQQLAELTAVEELRSTAAELRKNQAAEGAEVRKKLWGVEGGNVNGSDDEMGTTVLGDLTINHPAQQLTPQTPPPKKNNLALGAALAGLVGLSGVAGYFAAKNGNSEATETTQQTGFDDESLRIGLGRITDFQKD